MTASLPPVMAAIAMSGGSVRGFRTRRIAAALDESRTYLACRVGLLTSVLAGEWRRAQSPKCQTCNSRFIPLI
jgi:hypothetical protein